MNSKNLWLAGMATAALSAPALATADSGLFVGGSIGSTTIDETFDGIDLDADATAYRIVGGYQISDLLGIEVGYQDFGDIDEFVNVGPVSSLTSISADGRPSVPPSVQPSAEILVSEETGPTLMISSMSPKSW